MAMGERSGNFPSLSEGLSLRPDQRTRGVVPYGYFPSFLEGLSLRCRPPHHLRAPVLDFPTFRRGFP